MIKKKAASRTRLRLSAQGNLKLEILEFCACSGKLLIHTLLLRKRSKCAKKISLKGLLFVAKRPFLPSV